MDSSTLLLRLLSFSVKPSYAIVVIMTTSSKKGFQRIALLGRKHGQGSLETLNALIEFLLGEGRKLVLERETANLLHEKHDLPVVNSDMLSKHCDLIIVVGGDGSMLKAAHCAIDQNLPLLGINRGYLGFLTDIRPDEFSKIEEVVNGDYIEEIRFMLQATVQFHDKPIDHQAALNEVALIRGDVVRMVEFEVYIDGDFVSSQRADGLIVATPTGSTAYALSGGGPILEPTVDALVLVPIFPHTLSSRPIVVGSDNEIKIKVTQYNEVSPWVSCDGQNRIAVPSGDVILINKKKPGLRLIHPADYNYFQTLREKLSWTG